MDNKKCQLCAYFPCLKFQCNIGNKEGCEDFKSYTGKKIEDINKKD